MILQRVPFKGLTFGKTSVEETVEALLDAETVIITPGYGLAVAKAVRSASLVSVAYCNMGLVAIFNCRNGQAPHSSWNQGPICGPSR